MSIEIRETFEFVRILRDQDQDRDRDSDQDGHKREQVDRTRSKNIWSDCCSMKSSGYPLQMKYPLHLHIPISN